MTKQNICVLFICVLLCLLAIFAPVVQVQGISYAADNQYSGALEDLEKDPDFDVSNYPAVDDDYTLEVIQIAESANKELFVYIYQPWIENKKMLNATSISISIGDERVKYMTYPLELLGHDGVVCKYKVVGLTVKDDNERIYKISEIFRKWDNGFDGKPSSDNVFNEKAFEVAQQWTAKTVNGSVEYYMDTVDVVTLKNLWVGEELYFNGTDLSGEVGLDWEPVKTTSFFVAFSSDYKIDALYEADLTFKYRDYSYSKSLFKNYIYAESYGEWQQHELVTLTSEDEVRNPVHGIFGNKHVWKTIRSVEEFCETESLTQETVDKLQNDEWVLSFYTADVYWKYSWDYVDYHFKTQQVSEVAVLRLSFEVEGKSYDLGVVANKQTSDGKPDNDLNEELGTLIGIKDNVKTVGIVTLVVIVILIIVVIVIGVRLLKDFLGGGSGGTTKTNVHINLGKNSDGDKKKKHKK